MQSPICVNDFGSLVYLCRYLGTPVSADQAQYTGATIPGVNARYVMGTSPEAKAAKRASGICFADSERNCNTCKHLKRVPHEKSSAGFLYGQCTNQDGQKELSPYANRFSGDVMVFHPDDPMHMPCYESRWSE